MRLFLKGTVSLAILASPLMVSGGDAFAQSSSQTASSRTSGFNPPVQRAVLPRPLAVGDEERYRQIFALQERGQWRAADRHIAKIQDKGLMGHVLYQRYMHPTAYRSRYSELRRWMASYADHPDAGRVYKLALKRRPANASRPRAPEGKFLRGGGGNIMSNDRPYRTRKATTRSARKKARYIRYIVRKRVARGAPTSALKTVETREAYSVFNRVELDALRAQVAAGYFYVGADAKAYRLANKATRSGNYVPKAHWIAGLAAWNLKQYENARRHFESVTRAEYAGDWTRAGGAYWASRAHTRLGNFGEVSPWLRQASGFPRTFYGQLSVQALGQESTLNWDLPALDGDHVQDVAEATAGQRALALLQIGEDERAEKELRGLYVRGTAEQRQGIMAVASNTGMPSLAMRLGSLAAKRESYIADSALYPLPHWQPSNGFNIDRALMYAMMRQESAFNPTARSHMGARGLMQVMPQTAQYVARNNQMRGISRRTLNEPETNMKVGQAYIQYLLDFKGVGDNMFYVVAAYNAGPGNVLKWNRRFDRNSDPLMFIESIPVHETREYVERVFANYWMYRQRLEQPAPSLASVASHDWPLYVPLDGRPSTARVVGQNLGTSQ